MPLSCGPQLKIKKEDRHFGYNSIGPISAVSMSHMLDWKCTNSCFKRGQSCQEILLQ